MAFSGRTGGWRWTTWSSQWRTQGVSYDSPTRYHYRVRTAEGRFDLVYNVQADSWSVTELGKSREA